MLLKGVRYEYVDDVNLMGLSDISHFPFVEICELCRKYLRSRFKYGKGSIDALSRVTKSAGSGVTRARLGNLLENFKTNLLQTISMQLDTFKEKKNQDDENAIFSIFYSRCRQKHPLRDRPLNNVLTCLDCKQFI